MIDAGKRFSLLSPIEIEALYQRPHFDDVDQVEYFALTEQERKLVNQINYGYIKVYFLLVILYCDT